MDTAEHLHKHGSSALSSAFFLNLTFVFIEIIGALLTNSTAILANVSHDIGDNITLALAWYLEKLSNKGKTDTLSYGYKRFSLLGAFINSIILIGSSVFVMFEAFQDLFHPSTIHPQGMVLLAILGILFNWIAYTKLKGETNQNGKIVQWHFVQDVLGWVVVLIVSIVIAFKNYYFLDPILSLVIVAFILWNVLKNLKKTAMLFLQGVPEGIDITIIEDKIKGIPLVKDLHDTHVWSLDGENNVLSTHVVVVGNRTSHEDMVKVKCDAKKIINESKIQHATVEIECEDEKCDVENQ